MDATSFEVFKVGLDRALSNLKLSLPVAQKLEIVNL